MTRVVARRLGLAVCLLAAGLLAGTALAQEAALKSAQHDGYGRLVVISEVPIPYEAAIEDGRLVVSYGRPVRVDYGVARRALRRYIARVEPAEDGQSVRFDLIGEPTLRSFYLGSSIVIDLLDARDGAPPPLPRIGVRAGEHPRFSRVVFDWPARVDYRVSRDGDRVAVAFARPARLDAGNVGRYPPRYLRGIDVATDDDGARAVLTVGSGVGVKDFRVGSKVVLDLVPGAVPVAPVEPPAGAGADSPPESPAPESESQPQDPPPTARADEAVAEPGPESQGLPPPKAPTGEVATMPDSEPEPGPGPAPTPTASTEPATEPPPASAGAAPVERSPDTATMAEAPSAGVAPGSAARDDSMPTSLLPDVPAATEAETEPRAPAADQAPPGSMAADVAATAEVADGEASLRFDWSEPVAAAVFRRAGMLWIAFDRPFDVDVPLLVEQGRGLIRDVEPIAHENGTMLRVTTAAGVNPSLRRDSLAWILDLKVQPLAPTQEVGISPEPNAPSGARLFLPVPEAGLAMPVLDPAVGDNIVVVPVIPLGYGVARRLDYPQFAVLPSAQGVVVKPLIDDLRVRPLRQGVELTAPGSLRLSTVSEKLKAALELESGKPLSRLFDFSPWRHADGKFNQFQSQLANAAAATRATGPRQKARGRLAEFYLSQTMAAEALGVIRVMLDSEPEKIDDPRVKLLRGGANLLMARLDAAATDLDDPALNDNDEAMFWRGLLHAAQRRGDPTVIDLQRRGAILRPYPKPLKMRLGLLAAEGGLLTGGVGHTERFLNLLKADEPDPGQQARIDFLDGRAFEMAGQFDDALTKFEAAMSGPHRPSRAWAALARADLLFKLERMTAPEAIEALEKLRFAWRGDDFEFRLLRRLGQLYMAINDYRDGLRTLRQLATNFRDNPDTNQVTEDMAEVFESLYLDGRADELAPVTAIALYDEFKELTPPGDKGDEMIRRLADRLASVDLLERAAELLENQVKFRLSGEQKARVAARLGLVHLLAKQPERALATLEDSAMPRLPEDLARQRTHLTARALSDLGRTEEALDLLRDDRSQDAAKLRADIHWENQNWTDAAQAIREVLSSHGVTGRDSLEENDARNVLNLAVALNLGNNARALERMRARFTPAMDQTPFKDAYRLITAPDQQGLVDYRSVADEVTVGQRFQAFMASYRERLRQNGLSEIN